MRTKRKAIHICTIIVVVLTIFTGCGNSTTPDSMSKQAVQISVWHYYNGMQQQAFEDLVAEFNETVGREQGIFVESFSQGSVEGLLQVVLDAADKKVGAQEMPNICSAYTDTAYQMYTRGLTANLASYLTQEELFVYTPIYIEEGEFSEGELTIFPVAKATEVMVLNKTAWEPFSQECNISIEQLATYEQIEKVAEAYYRWTDLQTPELNDGKAFFGRDAMANLFFSAYRQMGIDLLDQEDGIDKLTFEKETARKIWDLFYEPYLRGYYYKGGRFSSDDMSNGKVIAYVGSSSGASYVPKEVMVKDNAGYPIEVKIMECPVVQEGVKVAIQQGAGMTVLNTTEEEVKASVIFLKWFTSEERNVEFVTAAGYLPVTHGINTEALFRSAVKKFDNSIGIEMAEVAMNITQEWNLYTPKAILGAEQVRAILENALLAQAQEDREAVLLQADMGQEIEEAIQYYLEDSHFEEWYERTKAELEAAVG